MGAEDANDMVYPRTQRDVTTERGLKLRNSRHFSNARSGARGAQCVRRGRSASQGLTKTVKIGADLGPPVVSPVLLTGDLPLVSEISVSICLESAHPQEKEAISLFCAVSSIEFTKLSTHKAE